MAYDGSIKIDTKIDTGGFYSGIEKMKATAQKGAAAITTTFTAVTAGIAAGGVAAVKTGSDFEAAMSRVAAISGAVGGELDKLKNQAIDLGAETAFSAKEAAEGMENLASAGFTVTEITKAMPGMLDLAASSGESLAVSSDIAASTLRGFGLAASEASHVADVLAKNAADTNAAVADTGEAMKYIAPLAKSAGISLEETAAAIGIMADNGIKGSQAGTTLRAALSRLSKPTDAMAAVMEKLKLEFYDSEGKMKSLSEQSKMLKSATKALTDEERNKAIVTLYGQEALSGMLALMNSEEGKLESLAKSYTACDGAAAEMAATMQNNLKSKVEELGGSLETLGITIYEDLNEPLKAVAEEGIKYVNKLTTAFEKGGFVGLIEEAGDIFAELAVKTAEAAPELLEATVSFIQSFCEGIEDNSDELTDAAKTIIKTIVDSLVNLLSTEIQEPVKEAINILSKSFEGGGLKKAINTVKTILVNLGKVATNLTKTVLPPFAQNIDFIADNLNTLLPITLSVLAAYKSWKAISTITVLLKAHAAAVTAESLAEAASLGTITLKQIAVGVLTGEITLATAAQYAWNLAMSANPIGVVLVAVTALAAGITALCLCYEDTTQAELKMQEANANLDTSNRTLAESYSGIGDAMIEFQSNIDNASSCLEGFDDSIILSNEKQTELAKKMDEVQTEITTIATTAKENRTKLTEAEIKRLEDLFDTQKKLAEQELKINSGRQQAVKDMVEDTIANNNMSLAEYESYSFSYIATAEEERDATINAARETMVNTLAQKRALIGTSKQYTEEWYEKQRELAQSDYDKAVEEANKLCGDTLTIIKKGYEDRATSLEAYKEQYAEYQTDIEKETQRHNDELTYLYDTREKELSECQDESGRKQNKICTYYDALIEEEKTRHTNKIADLKDDLAKVLDKDSQNQLAFWLEILARTETYGGKITEEDKKIVKDITDTYADLPDKMKSSMDEAMSGMLESIKGNAPNLFAKVSDVAGNVLNILRSVWDIHSPSRETNKIFTDLLKGGEIGFEKESKNLYKQTDEFANKLTEKLSNGVSTDGLVSKMRLAVSAGRGIVASKLTASVVHDVNLNNDDNNKKVILKGDITTKVNVDGRECAVLLTPYISEELAWGDK